MGKPYLSERNFKDGSKRLYAVTNTWNPEKKRQDKKQVYIGCKHGDGTYDFNEKTAEYLSLLRKTEYERRFYQWQDYTALQKTDSDMDPVVAAFDGFTDLSAGPYLLFSTIADNLKLSAILGSVFGEEDASKILSLAFYCASGDSLPLYAARQWSEGHKLPGVDKLGEADICRILDRISASDINEFLGAWVKQTPKENCLSMDITSVSSYSRQNPYVVFGCSWDKEKLPQVKLLYVVDQVKKLPVWFEVLPCAISDMKTLRDTIEILNQLGIARRIVCDRDFSCDKNFERIQAFRFKFTMGVALHWFPEIADKLKLPGRTDAFSQPSITVEIDEAGKVFECQGITKTTKFYGHRVYLHMYYCQGYKVSNEVDLMEHINHVTELFSQEKYPLSEIDNAIAERCFKPRRYKGRTIMKCDPVAVADLKKEFGGYFAIISNHVKDTKEALRIYKLREESEKRFDGLRNEEDCHRLRVHSEGRMRARFFIQFLAQILRSYILEQKQSRSDEWEKLKIPSMTVNEIVKDMETLRYIHIEGHHPFYKRPSKTQLSLLRFYGVDISDKKSWPSLH